MTTKLSWFKFYPADWLAARRVALMTPAQKGIYIDLLCLTWQEGSIPADPLELAFLLRLPRRVFEPLWDVVQKHFEPTADPRFLTNRRIETERASANGRSENGRNAAIHRHHGNAGALPTHSDGSAIQKEKEKETQKTEDPPPARARVIGDWGPKRFSDLWLEIAKKTPTGNFQLLITVADRIKASAEQRSATVETHAIGLVKALASLIDGWRKAKRPTPQMSVESLEKHFAACEEVLDGDRDPTERPEEKPKQHLGPREPIAAIAVGGDREF